MANENVSRICSDYESQLSGAIAVGATSFTIQSVLDVDGNTLSDGIYAFTIDRDSTGAKEYLIGQLTASTKTVSSISSVGRQGALTANAQRSHRIGANVIISDHSILAAISRIFTGVGTINPAAPLSYTTDPTLTASTDIATKGYVDSVVTGGTVNTDRIILGSQTAGETVAAGNIVYFKSSDSRWWLADADLTATFQNVQLGVALGDGTAGNAITGGVLIYGKCDSFTGLTATATYYLSNTAGAVATSAGTYSVILGQAFSTTGITFNPSTKTIPDWQASTLVPTGMVSPYAGATAPTGWLICNGDAVSRTTYASLFTAISTTYGIGDNSTTFNIPDLRARTPIGIGAVTKVATFASRSSNVITVTGLSNTASNEFQTGQAVLYTAASGAMTGLTHNTTYYLVRTGNLTFSLATDLANAQNGTVITLSSDGTGTQTFTLTLSTRTLGENGGEEKHAMSSTELLAHTHAVGRNTAGGVNTAYATTASNIVQDNLTSSTGGNAAMNNMQPFLGLNYIIKF